MPYRLIRVARKLSLLGLLFWGLASAVADVAGQTPGDQPAATQSGHNPVHFADASALPPGGGRVVAAAGTPTLAPPPLGPPPQEPAAVAPLPVDKPPAAKDGGPLVPVPDSKYLGPAEIEVTSFHGVTPGVSSREDVEKTWGKPKESRNLDNGLTQLYSVDPFPRVEARYSSEGKVAALVIRFEHGFPAAQVAEQLELSKVQPVLVSNELGEILGQSYPERGVLFSFEPAADPSHALKKVTHIVLEPITAEPFVLRAETNIDTRPEFSLHDADQAIKFQSGNARAHWLKSRALTSLGQYEQAATAAEEAVRLEPRDARYQVTKAQAWKQVNRAAEAIPEAEKAIAMSDSRPHVKARATCLLGDLKGCPPHPDFKQALQMHMQALQMADALITEKHPAIRVAAKEVLLDSHLGALHDIAWGTWREKQRSAENWLAKSMEIARDLVKNEEGGDEYFFRISSQALAADVGLRGKLDTARWAKELVRSGEVLISAAPELGRKAELQWQVASSLYDAMQSFQLAGDQDSALHQGELAINYLQKSGRQDKSPSAAYLLGRIYFRIGAIYVSGHKDHQTAVTWFEKAVPLLGKAPPPEAMPALGRLGDSFVSMGVSYWSAGHRKKAVALTEHGADLIEEAVRRGTYSRSLLAVPYSNLAAMQREMGDAPAASRAQELADRAKGTTLR